MNEYLGMLLVSDTVEWISLASGIGIPVLGGFGAVFWFYYRRDIQRGDAVTKAAWECIEQHSAKLADHGERLADHGARISSLEREKT